jgi:hypothetical protein
MIIGMLATTIPSCAVEVRLTPGGPGRHREGGPAGVVAGERYGPAGTAMVNP